jgi:hypothetical protein
MLVSANGSLPDNVDGKVLKSMGSIENFKLLEIIDESGAGNRSNFARRNP